MGGANHSGTLPREPRGLTASRRAARRGRSCARAGPLATSAKPSARASLGPGRRTPRAAPSDRAAGGRARAAGTGPSVSSVTPAARRSRSAALDLVVALAQAEHQAALGRESPGASSPARRSTNERALVARRRAHLALEALDRLEVVVQHVGPASSTVRERGLVAPVVRDQHLDADAGAALADRAHGGGHLRRRRRPARSSRATQVTTAKRRPQRRHGVGHARGLAAGRARRAAPVATSQKPQRRVQREPPIMKVAVPRAQHSLEVRAGRREADRVEAAARSRVRFTALELGRRAHAHLAASPAGRSRASGRRAGSRAGPRARARSAPSLGRAHASARAKAARDGCRARARRAPGVGSAPERRRASEVIATPWRPHGTMSAKASAGRRHVQREAVPA